MSLVLANDNITSRELDHLAPHKSMYNLNKPRSITDNARMPKPVASTIGHWLHAPVDTESSPDKISFMQAIAI